MNDSFSANSRSRPIALFAIAINAVLFSALIGGSTNAINGWISPLYFMIILGWQDVENIWRASIAQGILEGVLFGLLFSAIFTAGIGIISRASCRYFSALKYLLGIVVGAYICWAIGGLIAIALAWLSPEFYQRTFIGVPEDFNAMLGYAWVGGSIVGLQLGSVILLILVLVIFRNDWQRSRHDKSRMQ